jgi:hypothetical protein
MIKSAITGSAYFRLVTTTSIVAKLAVCAILLASMSSAHAAKNANDASKLQTKAAKASESKLAKLEREWKRLHSHRQAELLNRLVACRELGQCDGLKIHPTLSAARIRSAAADADGGDMNTASLPYGGASSVNR